MRQSYLVCCDVCDDKRLRKVFRTMCGYGYHLQYSVFECRFTARDRVITALGLPCTAIDGPCFIV